MSQNDKQGERGGQGTRQTASVGVVHACLTALLVAWLLAESAIAQVPQSRFAEVNGVRLHYLVAGQGNPVFLLHGYAETSHMWLPLIKELAKNHNVIAPDLRTQAGASALLSSKIVEGATLKVYPGAPHGMCSTDKDQVNAELLAFLKARRSASA